MIIGCLFIGCERVYVYEGNGLVIKSMSQTNSTYPRYGRYKYIVTNVNATSNIIYSNTLFNLGDTIKFTTKRNYRIMEK